MRMPFMRRKTEAERHGLRLMRCANSHYLPFLRQGNIHSGQLPVLQKKSVCRMSKRSVPEIAAHYQRQEVQLLRRPSARSGVGGDEPDRLRLINHEFKLISNKEIGKWDREIKAEINQRKIKYWGDTRWHLATPTSPRCRREKNIEEIHVRGGNAIQMKKSHGSTKQLIKSPRKLFLYSALLFLIYFEGENEHENKKEIEKAFNDHADAGYSA